MFPDRIDVHPAAYLERLGPVFARFDTQDSGNVSFGVRVGDARYFVKTAGDPDDVDPYLDFDGRIALLRNAVDLASSVTHPALPTLHAVVESPGGPLLVYDWRDGELLGSRGTPDSPHERFRALPTAEILAVLDDLYALHVGLDAAGWVEGDFYDSAMLYDFTARRLTVMDLDTYRRGPHRNDMGRMFGSTRFMAPEQFSLGAPIDSRTTAYVMARTALVLLSDTTLDRAAFRASDAHYAVVQEGTTTRFPNFPAFHAAWLAAAAAG